MAARSARFVRWGRVQVIPQGLQKGTCEQQILELNVRILESGHHLVKRATDNLSDCQPDRIELGGLFK